MNKTRVDYVLIGVLAINHYADGPSSAYSTSDCDVLLRPELGNLRRAARAVLAEGYELNAGGEPLPEPDDLILRRILERRANIVGQRPGTLSVDMVLDAGGMTFAEWKKGRRLFNVGRIRVPCAALEKLLLSKQRSGRAKDIEFLRLYRARLRDEAKERRRASGR